VANVARNLALGGDVQEHASEAFVVMATFTDNREEDVKPKVGWKLSGRAPEDKSRYLP
jgi:hypothetical protein